MKQSKLLVIIMFLVLLPLSWYKMYDNSAVLEQQYNNYLKEARAKKEMGITLFAQQNYDRAPKLHESFGIRQEAVKMYYDNKQFSKYETACQDLLSDYPKEPVCYENLAKYYQETRDFEEVFKVKDNMDQKKVVSKVVNQVCDEVQYEYYLDYKNNYQQIGDFYNGYAIVENKEGKKGLINQNGDIVQGMKYKTIAPFGEKQITGVTTDQGEAYLINIKGDKLYVDVEKKKITDIGILFGDKMTIQVDGKYYISDYEFKILSEGYDYIGSFRNERAAAKKGDDWFFIGMDGKKVSSKVYEDIILDDNQFAFANERAFVKQNGNYIMIDKQEKQVGKSQCQNAVLFQTQEPTAVQIDNKWGFIDLEGKIVIKPQYVEAKPFSKGLAAVKQAGSWCYINIEQKSVIQGEFNGAKNITDRGSSFVLFEGKWKLLKLYKFNH